MKHIIILLLLLPLFSFGQTVTIEDINDYSKKCYNDSSIEYYYTVCDNGCMDYPCNPEYNSAFQPCNKRTIHRKPTFEGFIAYLRKKYN